MRTQLVDGLLADLLQAVRFLRVYRSFFGLHWYAWAKMIIMENGIKGPFRKYVTLFLPFLDTLPPLCDVV